MSAVCVGSELALISSRLKRQCAPGCRGALSCCLVVTLTRVADSLPHPGPLSPPEIAFVTTGRQHGGTLIQLAIAEAVAASRESGRNWLVSRCARLVAGSSSDTTPAPRGPTLPARLAQR